MNLAAKTTLPEFVEVIRRAKILVSNDTAAVHISAAVGTPSVCILGGGHYGRFLPYSLETENSTTPVSVIHKMDCYNCNWICTQPSKKGKAAPCIANIRVEQVLNVVKQILSS